MIRKGACVVLTRSLGPGSLPVGSEGEIVHVYSLGKDVLGFEVEFGGRVGRKPVTCDMVKPARGNRGRLPVAAFGLKSWESELIRAAGCGDGAAFSALIHHARKIPGFAARAAEFWARESPLATGGR